MTPWLPRVRVAACNVAPIFLDTAKTVQKTIALIKEAALHRADLVVFPETHIPAFPLWTALFPPISPHNHAFFHQLARQSISPRGPELLALRQACAQHRIFAHIGFNERGPASMGCLWNAAVLIGDDGAILNHHRKLVPTFYEKLVWANGDGAGLRVVETERLGRIGGLICGENTNTLARYALMAQGEQLHVSTWPAVWPTRPGETKGDEGQAQAQAQAQGRQYDNFAANRTRTAAHCFEAKCFGVLCAGFMDKEMKDALVKQDSSVAETLDNFTQGASLFLDPTGAQVGDQVQGEEGIAYADLDLNACVEPKQFHDVVGGYQRLDVFDVKVDRKRREPVTFLNSGGNETIELEDEDKTQKRTKQT